MGCNVLFLLVISRRVLLFILCVSLLLFYHFILRCRYLCLSFLILRLETRDRHFITLHKYFHVLMLEKKCFDIDRKYLLQNASFLQRNN